MKESASTFEKRLGDLISKYGIDQRIGLPDFVIAEHLVKCVDKLEHNIKMKKQNLELVDF